MLEIEGAGGMIAAGSRRIAEIGAWRLRRADGETWRLRLQPVAVDTFWWGSARDVRVGLAFGERRWIWGLDALPMLAADVDVEVVGAPETFP